ncbi:MAG: hypothetical protein WBA05_17095 [Gordonia sp. (in: high G+C Gram-positive bacteria)]|uniref:hypothetical protein n=1 Tax=Gordonia sp. (in: high G+C Gram-positive bacteria) TaxID=84139 RepID=UPI003C763A69
MTSEWKREEVLRDARLAEWVDPLLSAANSGTVGSLVPDGYERYLRVLHPAEKTADDVVVESFQWADVARINGKIAHAEMQWTRISEKYPDLDRGLWNEGPHRIDFLQPEVTDEIAHLLGGDSNPRCVFAFWEGNTAFDEITSEFPKASIGRFNYYLTAGDVGRASQTLEGIRPNMWWPIDRSWYVCSNFDLDSTYIGADSARSDEIIVSRSLEAWPTRRSHRITICGDRFN